MAVINCPVYLMMWFLQVTGSQSSLENFLSTCDRSTGRMSLVSPLCLRMSYPELKVGWVWRGRGHGRTWDRART